jgi:ribosomal protein S18 acetylase RimI-like enzyme
MNIRNGSKKDLEFTKEMLFEACFWNLDVERPDYNEFFTIPDISRILSNWGRSGDNLIIVENEEEKIGAAWYRLWTKEKPSYGFVDAETPELGIGIKQGYRSQGIGRKLLNQLIETAKQDGFNSLSLSVDPGNFASILYESEGFKKVGESGTSWTYKLELYSKVKGDII